MKTVVYNTKVKKHAVYFRNVIEMDGDNLLITAYFGKEVKGGGIEWTLAIPATGDDETDAEG